MIPIIILQTSLTGLFGCQRTLTDMGLKEDKDFCIYDNDIHIPHCIVPGERQLFITGSLSGSSEGVAEMVSELRIQNPQLVCASFSIDPLPGPFDVVISKNRENGLQDTVQSFLKGELVRTVKV